MDIPWDKVFIAFATLGTSLGTAIGMQVANAMQRKTIDKTFEKKSEPLQATNENQEARIQALEAATFGYRPRAPPVKSETEPPP